jgi:dihydrofolate reductase
MKVIPTSCTVIFKDNTVLLVKHKEYAEHLTDLYGLPGGHIDEGESAKEAAGRELQEETGLVVSQKDLEELPISVPDTDIPRKGGTVKRFSLKVFYAKSYTGTLHESQETIPEWISLSRIDTIDLIGLTKKVIEDSLKIMHMNHPKISLIVAMDEDRGIGLKNKIPWHIREDLVRLKNLTVGHATILGRTTFESMLGYYEKSGKSTMTQRTHIVVTRDKKYFVEEKYGLVAHSIEEALEKAKCIEKEEIFVIGGAKIFEQTINHADKLYITVVNGVYNADTFFPDYSAFTTVVSSRVGNSEGILYQFIDLEK